ncbi:hypothetical protein GOBAR_AA39214 [Gossypium barbadense]|uniref:Uncharacterized protein n=1 Tax=Gossypium barbadense TaxID=3634 RepID=A0A2P5VRT7_GOSBA|nr:hypothetical protein GOBAR_AA39214 [Gossypium barbadense]
MKVTFSAYLAIENKSLQPGSQSAMAMPTYVGQPPPQVFSSNPATEFCGQGRGQSSGGTRLQCQICGKVVYDNDVPNPNVRSGQSGSSGFRRSGSSYSGPISQKNRRPISAYMCWADNRSYRCHTSGPILHCDDRVSGGPKSGSLVRYPRLGSAATTPSVVSDPT